MKKRLIGAMLATIAVLAIAGCGKKADYSLPDNPIAFETGTYVNPGDEEDAYTSIEYNGRTYIGYGTIKGNIRANEVGDCLGYIVQDGTKLEDSRVFLLADDTDANYLGRFDTVGVMNQPDFYRAIDTVGQVVNTPAYIDDLGYDFWKN